MFDERGGGGFPVGAGDADEAAVEEAIGQFDFAPDGDVADAGGSQNVGIGGDAGARNDETDAVENLFGVSAELTRNAGGPEFCGDVGEVGFGASIDRGDGGSTADAKERRRDAS